jgi:hypothetical protein
MPSIALIAFLFALFYPAAGHAQPRGREEPTSRGTTVSRAANAAPAATRISDALVAGLLELAKTNTAFAFVGIPKFDGDRSMLSINSSRALIVLAHARALEKGGRYTPPSAMRADVVFIECGNEDLGERRDCARLSISAPNGKRVSPIRYTAGPSSYRNALGAVWIARKVEATYRAQDLSHGFLVTYDDGNGTEYTYDVSREAATEELLLAFPSGLRIIRALHLQFSADGDVWHITNLDNYGWPRCVAELPRVSSVTVPALGPMGTASVRRSEFWPDLPRDVTLSDLSVTCWVDNKLYTVKP